MKLKTWKDFLKEMDHSKGTSNAMIRKAMEMEIYALRRRLRTQEVRVQYSKEAAKSWRAAATKYQKLAATRVR